MVLNGGGQASPQVGVEVVPRGVLPAPQRYVLKPAPFKLRLGRDHRLNDVPLAMRGRAKAWSSKPRAFQQNFQLRQRQSEFLIFPLFIFFLFCT